MALAISMRLLYRVGSGAMIADIQIDQYRQSCAPQDCAAALYQPT